jgi:phage gpG-like protein
MIVKTDIKEAMILFDNLQRRELPLHEIATVMVGSVMKNFIEQGRPEPWRERKTGGDWLLLMKTNKMVRSVNAHVTKHEILVADNRPYGKFQDQGTHNSDGSQRIDPRIFLLWQDEDTEQIDNILTNFFNEM